MHRATRVVLVQEAPNVEIEFNISLRDDLLLLIILHSVHLHGAVFAAVFDSPNALCGITVISLALTACILLTL